MAHRHQWITTRTQKLKNGKTMYFMECISAGCPNPNKVEIK